MGQNTRDKDNNNNNIESGENPLNHNTHEPSLTRKIMQFVWALFGIYFFYLYYGLMQEKM